VTTVVEFGTSFGISTLHLAAAVRDNGGGRVITTELNGSKGGRGTPHRSCVRDSSAARR
jgi:predicted O-methyltransferase YrrM